MLHRPFSAVVVYNMWLYIQMWGGFCYGQHRTVAPCYRRHSARAVYVLPSCTTHSSPVSILPTLGGGGVYIHMLGLLVWIFRRTHCLNDSSNTTGGMGPKTKLNDVHQKRFVTSCTLTTSHLCALNFLS